MNRKNVNNPSFFRYAGSWIFLFLLAANGLFAEGSKDFIDYPGYRLFYAGNAKQQIKVYANAGEFINVGASHVGITGGAIRVYRPDGTLVEVYEDQGENRGIGIIFNDIQEKDGPTGGGMTMGAGYIPGVIEVEESEAGIWTIIMDFPNPTEFTFGNLLNNQVWNRRQNQPSIQRGIVAWDVTVSQNEAGNNGGDLLDGRVYSNRYESVVSRNGNLTSPNYLVLTLGGYLYEIDFKDTDPWNFPLISNNLGIVDGNGDPSYMSLDTMDFEVSEDYLNWEEDEFYLYTPQAQNRDRFINNKIFFNTPSTDMPSAALTTNIFSGNTFETWLYNTPEQVDISIQNFTFTGLNVVDNDCPLTDSLNAAVLTFTSSASGNAELKLDLNNDGDYLDSVDVRIAQFVDAAGDRIFWDGLDGMGNIVPITNDFSLNYQLEVRNGEMHVLMQDVENNLGGVTFKLLNGENTAAENLFYYDHSRLGGSTSGGGAPGKPIATDEPFTYDNNFGNDRMLDYWAYVEFRRNGLADFDRSQLSGCPEEVVEIDTDGDGVPDRLDLDDENDGIPDYLEYCQSPAFTDCFAVGIDPSGDEDGDQIPNYMDADDPALSFTCIDSNADGMCDMLATAIDTDGDGHPNHLDLDSDNDGILDLLEAGHFQTDMDRNGIIDGDSLAFGANGFFNVLASDPDAFDAIANYDLRDKDRDEYPDFYDLDSDNDGIHDITEAGYIDLDENNNGRIDNLLNIGDLGLPAAIDPVQTGEGVPNPLDTDGDGYADYHDLDTDNDGINDVEEGGSIDLDNDGIIGSGLLTIDPNGLVISDFIGIILETTSHPRSTDGDGIPDFRDRDSDNDGINDVAEILKSDPDDDGVIGEGIPAVNVNGQAFSDGVLTTSFAFNSDIDLVANYRDLDSDNDGINDVEEATPFFFDFDNSGFFGFGEPLVNQFGQPGDEELILSTSFPTDWDNDGVFDFLDLDSDNDGIYDTREADIPDVDDNGLAGIGTPIVNELGQPISDSDDTILIATSDPLDTDLDGVRDYRDLDTDNDGIHDVEEANHQDLDNDGFIGTGLPVVNFNGVATADAEGTSLTATAHPKDTDLDLIPDWRDLDADNDGINDVEEASKSDPDNDGFIGSGATAVNIYGQATKAGDEMIFVTTSDPGDQDQDGVEDYNDLDTDNDGINDVGEASLEDPDDDGFIGVGIPMVNNYGQAQLNPFILISLTTSSPPDTDLDDIKDYRDLDTDNDGISDVVEGENNDPDDDNIIGVGPPIVNDLGQPINGDGIEFIIITSNPVDTDEDGVADFRDLDSDDDGLRDEDECMSDNTCRDGDNDGIFDFRDIDRDNDGIDDKWECEDGGPGGTCVDTDGDGIPDVDDLDTDDDGIADEDECPANGPCPDDDGDGIPEWRDVNCAASSLPNIVVATTAEFCTGDMLVLSAINTNPTGESISFTWTGPAGFEANLVDTPNGNFMATIVNVQFANAGTYTLQVVTDSGCAAQPVSVEVIINETPIQPEITAVESEVCTGESIVLMTRDYGANTVYDWYQITPNDTTLIEMTTVPELTLTANNARAGRYYVQVSTAARCQSQPSDNQLIEIVDLSDIAADNSTDQDNAACTGGNIQLLATLYEDATYEWIGPNGFTSTEMNPILENVTTAMAGRYFVRVTVSGCTQEITDPTEVYIKETAIISDNSTDQDNTACEGENIQFSATAYEDATYEWIGPNGFTSTEMNPTLENVSIADAGLYIVRVTVSGCNTVVSEPTEVFIIQTIQPELENLTGATCAGNDVQIRVSNNLFIEAGNQVSFDWYNENDQLIASTDTPSLTIENATVEQSGQTYLVVTINDCMADASEMVEVEVFGIPEEPAQVGKEQVAICDEEATIEAVVPSSGQGRWTTDSGASIMDENSAATTVFDLPEGASTFTWTLYNKGCGDYSSATVTVFREAAVIAMDDALKMDENEIAEIDVLENDDLKGVDYTFEIITNPDKGEVVEQNGIVIYTPPAGYFGEIFFEYEICNVSCPGTCSTARVDIEVKFTQFAGDDCFVPNTITPNDDGKNDAFTVPCLTTDFLDNRIMVFNRWGDKVFEKEQYRNDWEGTYENKMLPPGTYFYILYLDKNVDDSVQGYFTLVR